MSDPILKALAELVAIHYAHATDQACNQAAWASARAALAEQPSECNDNDSPWLVCKPCVATGKCAKASA